MKAVYELPLDPTQQDAMLTVGAPKALSEPQSILSQNVLWFCRLRWIVVATLLAYGCSTFMPEVMARLGVRPPGLWPFVTAALLAATNGLFRWLARHSQGNDARHRANLWLQIVSDLVFLTVVVHFMGELRDVVAFAYFFHIVLACIFFDRKESFIVLALALILYAALSALHLHGVLTPPCLFLTSNRPLIPPLFHMTQAGLFGAFGIIVWYLTSHLSQIVRQRDRALMQLNKMLVEAQEAKMRHMLRTTHELKAPFAAIQANVQLLSKGYCGALPPEALETLNRIDQRCRRLANEINEMLQLANLRSMRSETTAWKTLNVANIIRWCAAQIQPLATERQVTLDLDLVFCNVRGVEEQLRMLFSNLFSNAVQYSLKGGRVSIRCARNPNGSAHVVIEDNGIGIEAEKLPKIFEEYYRTDRAAQFNATSSGLGLAIVRHIVQTHGIRLRVESEPDHGTVFTLDFPPINGGQRQMGT